MKKPAGLPDTMVLPNVATEDNFWIIAGVCPVG